jgi:hypothetical protein
MTGTEAATFKKFFNSGHFHVSWCYSECISTPTRLKIMLGQGGNRTYDLSFKTLGKFLSTPPPPPEV